MQLNKVNFENNLFSYSATIYKFLSYHMINRFTFTPKVEDFTYNVMKEFSFVLEDATMEEIRIIYGIAQFIRDMGGLWMGILFMGYFIV
jgi:hypothetical protein